MPVSYSISSGGLVNSAGVQQPFVECYIQLPDAYPGNLQIIGVVQGVLTGLIQPLQQLAISSGVQTVALPAVPGAGNTFWNLQVDVTTGLVTVQTSSVSDPAPINGNNIVLARQTLPTGSTIPWLVGLNLVDFS